MSDAIKDTSTGVHNGHWTATASKSGTYEFATGGKFVDRDIDLVVPKAAITVSGSTVSGSVNPVVAVSPGTKASGKYPFSGSTTISGSTSGTATVNVGTKGFTDESSYSGTVTGAISGTATVSGSMNAIGLGVTDPKNINGTISSVTVGAKSGSTFPVTGSGSTSGTVTAKVTSTGYGTKDVETGSGTVSGSITLNATIPAAELKNSSTSGRTYTDLSTSAPILISGDYLYINEGYIKDSKISLARLVPDLEGYTMAGSDQMLDGYTLYDINGNPVTGNIQTKSSSNLTADGATIKVPAGYYAEEASKSVASGSVNSYTINESTQGSKIVTAGTVSSGYYPISVPSLTGTVNRTAGYISGTSSTATDSNGGVVGKIVQSTSSATNGSTLTAGSTLTIGAGYYHEDRTYTVPTAAGSAGTTSIATGMTNTISSGYTNPTFATSAPSGPYITINATASGDVGKVVSAINSPTTKYLSVYAGTYSIL